MAVATKSLSGLKVKDADKGLVEAVFSTFNVVDKDGDVTLPGAFVDGTAVRISAYGHASWRGLLPVGKGVVRTTDTEAILDGEFFMSTTAGRDTFEVVKQLGDLQEWSYSVEPEKASFGEFDDRQVQFLEKLKGPTEVSPVLQGAGVDTRTLALKGEGNLKFVEEATLVLTGVRGLLDRAAEVVALRSAKGKSLAADSADLLSWLRSDLKRLDGLLDDSEEDGSDEQALSEQIAQEHLRFIAASQ